MRSKQIDLNLGYSGFSSEEICVFLHGWPDDASLWASLVAALSPTYRCVTVTLPGFSLESGRNDRAEIPFLLEELIKIVREIRKQNPEGKITLVGHDWGAFFCYLLESRQPNLIDRLVTLDVGGQLAPSSFRHAVFLVGYQWWLIAAWWIGVYFPSIGDGMSRAFAKSQGAPAAERVKCRMNYLYFYFWRALFRGSSEIRLPRRYLPRVPTLFLYGGKKRYMFHSPRWLESLGANPLHRVVEVKSAGHWLTHDAPGETNSTIQNWLSEME